MYQMLLSRSEDRKLLHSSYVDQLFVPSYGQKWKTGRGKVRKDKVGLLYPKFNALASIDFD